MKILVVQKREFIKKLSSTQHHIVSEHKSLSKAFFLMQYWRSNPRTFMHARQTQPLSYIFSLARLLDNSRLMHESNKMNFSRGRSKILF
jgi:hypothetical protein